MVNMVVLQTPQIISVNAFNPNETNKVEYVYYGNQCVKSEIKIMDNQTSMQVFNNQQNVKYIESGGKSTLYHEIPSNTLLVGKQYTVQIKVYDEFNNSSEYSNPSLFYCYSNPNFTLSGVTNNEVVRNSYITVTMNYSQAEGETLKNFQFFLYNSDGTIEKNSNVLYITDSIEYTFYNLHNGGNYRIVILGETNHGIKLTNSVNFIVQYEELPSNILFKVENNKNDGYINLASNFIDIGYDLLNNNYSITEDAYWQLDTGVDVTRDALILVDNTLTYNKGFTLTGDFLIRLEIKGLMPYDKPFFSIGDDLSLSLCLIYEQPYFRLKGKNTDIFLDGREVMSDHFFKYGTYSERVTLNGSYYDGFYMNTENLEYKVIFEIIRQNGIYQLNAYEDRGE